MKIYQAIYQYYLGRDTQVLGLYSTVELAKEKIKKVSNWGFIKTCDYGHHFSILETEIDTNKSTSVYEAYTVGTHFQKYEENRTGKDFFKGECLYYCKKS